MSESRVLAETMLRLGCRGDMKIWRNNTGQAWQGDRVSLAPGMRLFDAYGRILVTASGDVLIRNARPVNFGLPGSGDIAGILAPSGRALYVECKDGKGRQSERQKNFMAMIRSMGGVYVLARSADEAEAAIAEERKKTWER